MSATKILNRPERALAKRLGISYRRLFVRVHQADGFWVVDVWGVGYPALMKSSKYRSFIDGIRFLVEHWEADFGRIHWYFAPKEHDRADEADQIDYLYVTDS